MANNDVARSGWKRVMRRFEGGSEQKCHRLVCGTTLHGKTILLARVNTYPRFWDRAPINPICDLTGRRPRGPEVVHAGSGWCGRQARGALVLPGVGSFEFRNYVI